jgi:hypothetical protein
LNVLLNIDFKRHIIIRMRPLDLARIITSG